MTDFDYDPIPLTLPERLSDEAMLSSAIAHRDLMLRRRTVRHFSDEPVQRAVIEACILTQRTAEAEQTIIILTLDTVARAKN